MCSDPFAANVSKDRSNKYHISFAFLRRDQLRKFTLTVTVLSNVHRVDMRIVAPEIHAAFFVVAAFGVHFYGGADRKPLAFEVAA